MTNIKNRSLDEFKHLYEKNNIKLISCDRTSIKVILISWLNLTNTDIAVQNEITKFMINEINGGEKTGLYPYIENDVIYFNQRWLFFMGIKTSKITVLF